ncbi:MAG: 3-oxoacyl-ACP synthase III [Planctomycetes bacterium]|nr:3-oxoacyl-ACP synthase III [Planctomycetota bacterium]
MRFQNVCIEGFSHALGERVVTSEELERRLAPFYERMGFSVGRIELMSGIRERRFFASGTKPSDISARAGERVLEQTGFDRSRIGCVIHSSVCRDHMEPATAATVHRALKLPAACQLYDVSNACLGFANAMLIVANMIELGQIEAGMVVAGEDGGPLVEATVQRMLTDASITRKSSKLSFASLTIGSGGAAVILTSKKLSTRGHRLVGGAMRVATEHNQLCQGGMTAGNSVGPLMETDSETLMHHGIALAAQTWRDAKESLGWNNGDVGRVFTHQVGSAHRKMVFSTLELEPKLDFPTVETLGNIGSAALPVAVALGSEQGVIKRGDKVALLGIGSGLVCLNLGLEW